MSRSRLVARILAVGLVLCTAVATATTAMAAAAAPPPGTPTARTYAGDPSVGPIFRDGLQQPHGCTASVIDSPARDLILTAAHCVYGSARGWVFAPGYRNGRTPYGSWTVVHAYLPPAWQQRQDPKHDYAILQVADQTRHGRRVGVQDVAPGSILALAPRSGDRITDIAYNEGISDRPVRCSVPIYLTHGYPTFSRHGYVGGSSGSPWLTRLPGTDGRVVRGVIGGLHQGGCYDYTSYSSPFGVDIYRLYLRAVGHIHPDIAPVAGGDGC